MSSSSRTRVDVEIEYCGVCNFKSHCLKLSEKVRKEVPDTNVVCKKGRRGSFEVSINNQLVHSKLQKVSFPNADDVVQFVKDAKEGKELKSMVTEEPITDCCIM